MLRPGSNSLEVPMRLATGLFTALSFVLVACGGGGGGGDDTGDDTTGPDAGDDPPPPAVGFQIVTPDITIEPGQEITYCYYTTIDIAEPIGVKRWSSTYTQGSHHLILYFVGDTGYADGTVTEDCNLTGGGGLSLPQWTYSAGTPQWENAMPDGVGMTVNPGQKVAVQLHYLNTSPSTPIDAHAVINAEGYEPGVQYTPAAAYITYNQSISIPPNGTASAQGTCAIPDGATFFTLSTHAHRRATHTEVRDGSTVVFSSDDWEHPGAVDWRAAPHYQFSGDLTYHCDYQNDLDQTVTDGDSAATDEMCMAVGYFFPATEPVFCPRKTCPTRRRCPSSPR